jgi:hypothetical protein
MRRRSATVVVTVLLVSSGAWAQFGRGGDASINAHMARADSFDGRFHYCRLMYRMNPLGDGGSWLTDYPLADIDLSIRLSELTKTLVAFARIRAAGAPDRSAHGRSSCFIARSSWRRKSAG